MGSLGNYSRISLILIVFVLIALKYQNCGSANQLNFSKERQSLSSSVADGGPYDGKPEDGHYCRVSDALSCQSQVANLQSLVKVDRDGIHVTQDNCASTSTDFRFSDAGIEFNSLAPNFIGVTRGIFKKCEVDSNNLPQPSTEMTDAFCTAADDSVVVIVNKNIINKKFDFTLTSRGGTDVRMARGQSITKATSSTGTVYFSDTEEFNLDIRQSIAQTATGQLQVVVDQKPLSLKLNCRQANPEPTVIIEKDLELSPTWMDLTRLVGYWKLNEVNSTEGTIIRDSSPFGAHGSLFTGNDGLNKSDTSILGGAISFDGGDDSGIIPYPSDGHLDFGTGSVTYMAWIKKTGNAGFFDMPVWHGGNSGIDAGYDIECGSATNGCMAMISDGQGSSTSVAFARFANSGGSLIGRWVLLTAVVDRSNQELRAYLDGVLISTTDISNVGSINSNRQFRIGSGNLFSYFVGSVDDVSVWNGVLSDSQIIEIFQRLRPKFF